MKINAIFSFVLAIGVSGLSVPSFSQDTTYVPDKSTYDLYYDFTGVHPANPDSAKTIGLKVAEYASQSDEVKGGKLVLLTSDALHIFSEDRTRDAKIDTRTADYTGFYEVTSLSHVGPALAYLAYIKEQADIKGQEDVWESSADSLLVHIRKLKKLNEVPLLEAGETVSETSNWLDRLNNPAWNPHKESIRNLFNYAYSFSGNYLHQILNGEQELTSNNVREVFLRCTTPMSDDYNIPFNYVMIATFQLEGLSEFHRLHRKLDSVNIDWKTARIIVRTPVGNNFGGGLSTWTNWTIEALNIIAGVDEDTIPNIDPDRLLIAAYSAPQDLTLDDEGMLSDSVYNYYTETVFGALYAQTYITNLVFSDVKSLARPKRTAMPGDHSYTPADSIDHFVQRLKYSFGVKTELLSNTIGFWMPQELANCGYDPALVKIPGLNAGEGLPALGYPSQSPDIEQ